jgi:hypothetical protein
MEGRTSLVRHGGIEIFLESLCPFLTELAPSEVVLASIALSSSRFVRNVFAVLSLPQQIPRCVMEPRQ